MEHAEGAGAAGRAGAGVAPPGIDWDTLAQLARTYRQGADGLPCRHGCRAAADELAQETQHDDHTGACGPLTAPGDPEPAEPANGPQTGADGLDYPDAAANAEAENAWRQGEDHL